MGRDWMPNELRAMLSYGNSTVEITEDITNWPDLATSLQRDGISGVFMSVDLPIKVKGPAKEIIHELFFSTYLRSTAHIEILKRHPYNLSEYTSIHRAKLNFSSFMEDRNLVTISSDARDFVNLVKSVGKTKYDIPVSSMTPRSWEYKHNNMLVTAGWEIAETEYQSSITNQGYVSNVPADDPSYGATFEEINETYTITTQLTGADMVLNGLPNDIKSQPYGYDMKEYFIKVTENPKRRNGILTRYNLDFWVYGINLREDDIPILTSKLYRKLVSNSSVQLDYIDDNGNVIYNIGTKKIADRTSTHIQFSGTIGMGATDNGALRLTFKNNTRVESFGFMPGGFPMTNNSSLSVSQFVNMQISYIDKNAETYRIPVVQPSSFINTLLSTIATKSRKDQYTAIIGLDNSPVISGFNHFLVAGEAIRGYKDPHFHISLNDFLDYMKFLGYEWEVDETAKRITFLQRDELFAQTTAINLEESEVSNLEIIADEGYAYSTVHIGYEKPDVENANGRFALMGAFDYTTDFDNVVQVANGQLYDKDSALEIRCPYKADPVEMEILSWSRGEKTTDKKDDNSVFMLAGTGTNTVTEYRGTQYDIYFNGEIPESETPPAWFNAPYAPYFIALRNRSKIGISAVNLIFTGTDSFKDARMVGDWQGSVYGNITLGTALFKPFLFNFDVGTHKEIVSLANKRGLVRFMWDGVEKQGFIKKITRSYIDEMTENWELLGYKN